MKNLITTFTFLLFAMVGSSQTTAIEKTPEDLNQYLGTYESVVLPMEFIISMGKDVLMFSTKDQLPDSLKAEGKHEFSIEKHGVIVLFEPDNKKMIFKQRGMTFEFKKKE